MKQSTMSYTKKAATKPQRTPIAAFKDGFTLEQTKQFRSQHEISKWLSGGDISVWVNLRMSEVLPTAAVPNRQLVRDLPTAYNPAVGTIKAETDLVMTVERGNRRL